MCCFFQGSLKKNTKGSINQGSTNPSSRFTAKEERKVNQRSSNSTEDGTLLVVGEERIIEEFGEEEDASVADA